MSSKRIALNVVATYAQTVFSIAVGLFCSRWVYNALGETKFGLFSVVGSLIAFIAILNATLIGGSGRFFAFALGQQSRPGADKDILCKWFNTALSVQTIIPLVLVVVGAPIGVYAIRHVLNIPDELRQSSVILFGFSLFTMFAGMLLSPVQALYQAKQYIFVRNGFDILNTVLFAAEGWWLLHYRGNRLIAHAVASTGLFLLSNLALAAIAYRQFPEARVRLAYWFDKKRLREMIAFSSFLLFGTLGTLFGNSGVAIVLNKLFGPAANAAMGIGNQIYQKTSSLSQAMNSALLPEITARVGAGRFDDAKRLAIRACVYSTAIALLAIGPLVVHSQRVLVLWLKEPAAHAAQIAVIMLMNLLVEKMTAGYMMLVQASGRIKVYTTCLGVGNGARCFVVLALLLCRVPLIPALWLGWFLPFFILNQMRVWFAKHAIGVSIRQYLARVLLPTSAMTLASFAASQLVRQGMGNSVGAILVTGIANAFAVVLSGWALVGSDERAFARGKARAALQALRRALGVDGAGR